METNSKTMNLIFIDKDLCTKCGICVKRCSNFSAKNGDDITSDASNENCNRCGHCVALCPFEAIVHHDISMENCVKSDGSLMIGSHELSQIIINRRSHRFFKDKKIQNSDLEKLVDICRYSPTGNNTQHVELLVIQDKKKIQRLADHTIDFFANHMDTVFDETEKSKFNGLDVSLTSKTILSMQKNLEDIVLAKDCSGEDNIFYQAPVVIVFHAPADNGTPKDDCVIASTIMAMYARTLSLESCYIGHFELVANRYQSIIKELDLPLGNKVFSTLILGYPAFKFARSIARQPLKVGWV